MKRHTPMKRSGRIKTKGKRRFPNTRDDPYRDWITTQPCLVAGRSWFGAREHVHRCQGVIHPHHTTSKGKGGHDRSCVPLCALAHRTTHDWGVTTFARRYGIDWTAEVETLQARYLTTG